MDYNTLLIQQLKDNFKDITVYDEPIQQVLSTPCFVINMQKTTYKRLTGLQSITHVFFFLTYYPKSEFEKRSELNEVMAVFNSGAFRYLGGKMHIHDIDTEHNDDVLTVAFSVDFMGILPYEGDKIKSMEGGANLGKDD